MSTAPPSVSPTAHDLPPEVALLRRLTMEDVPELRRILSDGTTDTARFLRFAHRHKLGSFTYSTLKNLGIAELLDPRLRTAAKAAALREREVNDGLVSMLCQVREIFERASADVLFLKGPLFSQRFYGNVDARGVADIDVLARSEDVDEVGALLLENGFERASRLRVGRRLSRLFAHHFEYRQGELPLDLHWTLQRHYSFDLHERRIWDNAAPIEFAGHTFPAPSDEHELVLQILGVVTDLQVGKLTLRPVVDIYRILCAVEGRMDWGEFFAWRERERTRRPSAFVLSFVLDVLDCADRFPELRRQLQPLRGSLPPISLAFEAALRSRPTAAGQKLLALRLYETPLAAAISWWIVSLPFRFAVYGITRR